MQLKTSPIILVDADACPVKEEISLLGNAYNVEVYFVASYSHVCNKDLNGSLIYVDEGKESANLYILNKAKVKM
ncbi:MULTISPECIES: hypothetical protein [Bacillus]|uniref:hypothetical protein n=1 Tax=Bacillus TaxID=1386 RepID=UPI00387386D1